MLNRHFGVLTNGDIKFRGIEARRRDIPFWVKKVQLEVLTCLAKAKTLDEIHDFLPEIQELICKAKRDLKSGLIPLEELVVTQSLSRAVEGYKTPSPAVRAAMQYQRAGHAVAPGQFMRFVSIRGRERVRVWELGVDRRTVDVKRYCILLDHAVAGLVGEFEKEEARLAF